MRLFSTFKGFKNKGNGEADLIWEKNKNEIGEDIKGHLFSEKDFIFDIITLKLGSRYIIECDNITDSFIINPSDIRKIHKSPKCGVFRRFKDEFHIISGKHQGKKDAEIQRLELMNYCIWLAKNTYNEFTVKNALEILKKYK